jgi:hypothetical protein
MVSNYIYATESTTYSKNLPFTLLTSFSTVLVLLTSGG